MWIGWCESVLDWGRYCGGNVFYALVHGPDLFDRSGRAIIPVLDYKLVSVDMRL